jgi:pilus assembly protein Flp/PilA
MIEKIQFMALKFMINRKAERDERGATAVEYGLLVALIAAVIVATVAVLGGYINDAFTTVNDKIAPTP